MPHIINDSLMFNNNELAKIEDLYLIDYKPIQYLGKFKDSVHIKFKEFERTNAKLNENYRSDNKIWNKFFTEKKLNGIEIFVDTKQITPIISVIDDFSSFSKEEIDEYEKLVEKLNKGIEVPKEEYPTAKIPKITTLYDAFPVIVRNNSGNEQPIGFGNVLALDLEILNDKTNSWIIVYPFRKYTCGTAINFFVLKQNEIAVVFEPRLYGNLKGKFRYRLANIVSNVFDGSIDEKYIEK